MIDELSSANVFDEEWLARMVFAKRHFRPSNNTVKEGAFLPQPAEPELSMTRHLGLSEEEIWQSGKDIASVRIVTLYGRADLQALTFRGKSLQVRPDPPPMNHAVVTGWPPEKSAQMIIAKELAASARFSRNP